MNRNENILTLETFIDYYKDKNCPYLEKDFILFELSYYIDYPHEFTVNNGFLISLIKKGNIDLRINYKNYKSIEAPALVSVPPNYVYETSIECHDARIDSLFISFDCLSDLHFLPYTHYISQMMLNPVLKISNEKMYYLEYFISQIKDFYRLTNSPAYSMILKTLLYPFLMEVINYYSTPDLYHPHQNLKKITTQEDIVNKFFKLLEETRPIKRNISSYAEELYISPRYLSYAVKNVTNCAASKWINNAIILEAKKMLKLTSLSIQEISEKLNFESSAYFIYFFKKATGKTPLVYRNGKLI